MSDFVERTWINPDGLKLSARDYAGAAGDARLPVICLHGLTRNARDFEDVAPTIAARGRRVLAMDVRGRGRSERDPIAARYIAPVYAGDVTGFAVALGIGRAQFVGTSMGGLIMLVLATLAPELVAGGVINDVGPELAPEGLIRIGSYAGLPVDVADWAGAAAHAKAVNAAAFPSYGDDDWARFARRMFVERNGRPVLDYDPAVAANLTPQKDAPPPPNLWSLFDDLVTGRPILLVHGLLSDLLTTDIVGRMRERAPLLGLCEVAGVGHAPMLTEPEAKIALERFFDKVE